MNSVVTCDYFLIVGLKTNDQMNMNSGRYRDIYYRIIYNASL
jgi:hypothetical protein